MARQPEMLAAHAEDTLRWLVAKLISRRRAPVAREIYARIGGRSPLRELMPGKVKFVFGLANDVESQIHLLKIHVKRHQKIEHARVEKHKPDQTDKAFVLVEVQLRAARNTGRQ